VLPSLFERALAINEKTLRAEHPGTAAHLCNLARLRQAQGDLAAARPLSAQMVLLPGPMA
jgi:hypothetical protein